MSTVWGVDVSTFAIDIVRLELAGRAWTAAELDVTTPRGSTQPARLSRTLEVVESWTWEAMQDGRPAVVYVERPTGKHPSPLLTATAGVAAMAIERVLGQGNVHLVPIGQWKKASVGKGNAKKDEIMAWARDAYGYAGERQDTADALGVAHAARVDVGRAT